MIGLCEYIRAPRHRSNNYQLKVDGYYRALLNMRMDEKISKTL